MKIFYCLLLIIFSSLQVSAQDKTEFDIQDISLRKLSGTGNVSAQNYQIKNSLLEATMISGGYFTIGTINGHSTQKADDLCSITYGHPYALTSYPLFSVDGVWYKPDEYFSSEQEITPRKSGDTLVMSSSRDGLFEQEFRLFIHNDEITISLRMKNSGSAPHNFRGGVVFDPSLGRWGDGFLKLAENFIENDTTFSINQSSFTLWEKSIGAKGIGISLSSDDNVNVIAGNWSDLYKQNSPEFSYSELRKLYDLLLKFYFEEKELQAGEEIINSITLRLLIPDFSSKIFARWDLPSFITITNGNLFPKDIKTSIELLNNSENAASVQFSFSNPVYASVSTVPGLYIQSNETANASVNISFSILYENKIAGITTEIIENGELVDIIRRNVFIPATPVSDTGLIIEDDSLDISAFPQVELFFSVENEQSGNKIRNLTKENIFLYDNGERVKEFSLDKDNGGIVEMADVVFVLDVSGSMDDNLAKVRNNLGEFADSLEAEGYDYQIGVVTFSTTVDDIWGFTTNIEQLKQNLAGIITWGGEEDSPSALYKASEFPFRPGSKRTIIWLTDEPYTLANYTKQQVVNRMLSLDITVYGIGLNELQTDWFNPIITPTGGKFYDIYGNFRDILLDVTRGNSSYIYKIAFESINTASSGELNLVIHYAGLGGSHVFYYQKPQNSVSENNLKFYPNPFNPQITFVVDSKNFTRGNISVYNILGQQVKTFSIEDRSVQKITWNATNDIGAMVSTGFYIVKLTMFDNQNRSHIESAKILYLK